nr:nucleotidyltransferase domain-containing protein [uncultured Moellerella sp.]
MALDANGYIKIPSSIKFQTEFEMLINDVISQLTQQAGAMLHSIYIYGSVAEGRALAGKSDLDLCIIFNRNINAGELKALWDLRLSLEQSYPIVSKIDFDIGILAEVLDAKNRDSWGYWLKHHCRIIFGADLSQQFEAFKPSKAIAMAVNGDYISVLNHYIYQISECQESEQTAHLQRAAARKLLRSTNILRTDQDIDWPDTLEQYVDKFIQQYPQLTKEIDFFLAESYQPEVPKDIFIKRLKIFMQWLIYTIKTQN